MKLWKRLTTLALAVMMLCSMSLVVFAAGDNQDDPLDITITNTVSGAKYHAFRLLNASASLKNLASCEVEGHVHQSSCYNVGYAIHDKYLDIIEEITGISDIDSIYKHLQGLNTTQTREFADAVYAEILAKQNDGETGNGYIPEMTIDGTGSNAVFTNIGPGYWLIVEDTSEMTDFKGAYSLVVLDTSGNRDISVHTKREQLTLTKKILDNATNYGTYADMEIGETAIFMIEADVPDLAGYDDHTHDSEDDIGKTVNCYKYVIHDKMDAGLSFNKDSVEVFIDRLDDPKLNPEYGHYQVVTEGLTDGCAFHIEVNMEKALTDSRITFAPTHKLVIRYTAKLNDAAKLYKTGSKDNLADEANENKAWLNYSNNPYDPASTTNTAESSAYVWTLPITVHKTDITHASLDEAIFVMTRDPSVTKEQIQAALGLHNAEYEDLDTSDGTWAPDVIGKLIPLVSVGTEGDVSVYRLKDPTAEGFDKTDKNNALYWFEAGKVVINGLDDETDYYLHEIRSPRGYNILKDAVSTRIHVKYAASETAVFDEKYPRLEINGEQTESLIIDVINQTGAELPSTGGIGTTIFYVLGGIMVLGAVVLLITKKRMSVEV